MTKVLYFHINKLTQEVFYVGIGNSDRPYKKDSRSQSWRNYINKYEYEVKIIKEGLTIEQAYTLERFWIKVFGRKDLREGLLVNHTEGGEGLSDFWIGKKRGPQSEEHKKKLKESGRSNFPRDEEYKAKLRKPWSAARRQAQTNKTKQ